jgi:DNA polymerase-3 subunit epsilon
MKGKYIMEPYSASLFDEPAAEKEAEGKRKKGRLTLVRPLSYVVMDLETTGLDPRRAAIIEIGGITVRAGTILNRFQTFVRPEPFQKLTPFISQLTGITDQDLMKAPSFASILPSLRDFIGGHTIVGHNVNFDINFLYDRIFHLTGEHMDNPYLDTKKLAKMVLPNLPHYSLEYLCQYFNIEGNHHRAIDDCLLTEKLLQKLSALR